MKCVFFFLQFARPRFGLNSSLKPRYEVPGIIVMP